LRPPDPTPDRALPAAVLDLVRRALEEDGAARDVTTVATVSPEARGRGVVLAKQALVLSGLDVARAVFETVDPGLSFERRVAEGERVEAGTVVGTVTGSARSLLSAERVALNFLQRLCGVATLTRCFVDAVAGTKAQIRDTRKTTPLLRALEKRAVQAGGGTPHRAGLDGGVLVKDNHVRLAGGVAEATRRARAAAARVPVEIEVESLSQVEAALGAGADMLLLDNFAPEDVRRAIDLVAGRVPVEASGGIRLENVRAFAEAGPDFIAVGALTHSAPAGDLSLEIEPLP
jgi:nicotinate-nucleotide pyrophosphorylase (carboxylating)